MRYLKHPLNAEELRRLAKEQFLSQGSSVATALTPLEAQQFFEELEIHQIELRLQNEHLDAVRAQLEMALDQSSTLYDFAPVGNFTLDRTGAIAKLNLAAANLLGSERARLLGSKFGLFVSDAERPAFNALFDQALNSGDVQSGELSLSGKDLPTTQVQIKIAPFFEAFGCQVILQDITERKSQEEALRRSESLLRQVLEALPVGVWIADKHGDIVMGNQAGQRIWRGSRYVGLDEYGEYEGWWAATGKKIEPQEWALARAVTQGETSLGEVVHIRCFDGSHKTILNSAIPLLGPAGVVESAIVVNEDITERQRIDDELRVSKELFQTTFDFASVGIALCDLEGRFLLVNPAFCATVGFAEPELLARSFHDITHPEDLSQDLAESRRLLAGEIKSYQLEKRYVHKHGQTVWVLLSVALVRDKEDGPVYFIGQIADITQRKQVEEELLRSRQQLRELAAYSDNVREVERKRIAREVHDELGQQLTALRMRLSFLLQQHDEDPEMTGQMTEMRLLVDRMVGVVRHVVSNLRPAPLDLGIVPALEWLAEDFERHSGIHCRFHMPDVTEDFNDALMLDDARATALFRIVQESLTNAARHSGAVEVTVSLKVGDEYIALQVEDNGKGFDPTIAHADRSFGLLGMRERILILQGELQINSAPGRGTVVSFKLPVNRRARTRTIGNGVQEE